MPIQPVHQIQTFGEILEEANGSSKGQTTLLTKGVSLTRHKIWS